jgi:hypothetical protein
MDVRPILRNDPSHRRAVRRNGAGRKNPDSSRSLPRSRTESSAIGFRWLSSVAAAVMRYHDQPSTLRRRFLRNVFRTTLASVSPRDNSLRPYAESDRDSVHRCVVSGRSRAAAPASTWRRQRQMTFGRAQYRRRTRRQGNREGEVSCSRFVSSLCACGSKGRLVIASRSRPRFQGGSARTAQRF